ncbi:MAG: alpha/beta fold hydrolase [Desulfurivibrionaceae bacterium]
MKLKKLLLILSLSWPMLSSCAPKEPIPVLEYGKMDASEHRNLLIILRGFGGSHHDFEKNGIINEVRRSKLPFDIVVPAAHFGYYRTETLPERLKHDIIDPARAKGYRDIWLAGFSMGGLGSLFTVRRYPEAVNGVILVSPFLGKGAILTEIEEAGGVGNWSVPAGREGEWQYDIWAWLKEYNDAPRRFPEIHLGYGDNDPVIQGGSSLLARSLRPEDCFTVPGRHDYETFKEIWRRHLELLGNKLQAMSRVSASAD